MNTYLIRSDYTDGTPQFVEAPSFASALAAWQSEMVRRWKVSGDYQDGDENVQPDSLELVSEEGVIRVMVVAKATA